MFAFVLSAKQKLRSMQKLQCSEIQLSEIENNCKTQNKATKFFFICVFVDFVLFFLVDVQVKACEKYSP